MGPFANYLIYLGICAYYIETKGCDVIKGHTVGLYKDHTSQNIYYEAEGQWSEAIKSMVSFFSFFYTSLFACKHHLKKKKDLLNIWSNASKLNLISLDHKVFFKKNLKMLSKL